MESVLKPLWKQIDQDKFKNPKVICGVLVGCYITNQLVRKAINVVQKNETRKKINAKQAECKQAKETLDESLRNKGIPRESVERITSLSFKDLQKGLQSGKLTAVEVLHAYQIKALEVDKRINCITEVVREAEGIAVEKDDGVKGPLYGIPVSIKENYMMPGYPCTGGMIYYLDDPVTDENVLVQVLKKQGAVPFVRTNVPQTMMSYECSNPLYGITVNPHDPTRIPGGSSGGEAALVGGGGSILGMGTDIGGSVRIPAHMCGCCSIKPTGGRISRKGCCKFNKGQTLVQGQTGPMAMEVDALVACMKALLVPEMFSLDPTVPPIPFREEIYTEKKGLTIGFYIDDGYIKPAPACQRAVLEVKAVLEAQGHTLVPFKPVDVIRMIELFSKACLADGGKSFLKVLEKDIVDPSIAMIKKNSSSPRWVRQIMGYIAKWITKDEFMKIFVHGSLGLSTVGEYWDLALEIEKYKSDFLKKWKDHKLDAVICPGFAFPAVPHGKVGEVLGGVTYTNLYNVLDYPVGSLNITKVTQMDIDNFKDYPTNTIFEKNIRKYSEGSVGLPINVQFSGLPYQEEQVLRLMKEVETHLRK